MVDNNQIILEQIVHQNHDRIAPELPEWQYFELFAAEQILKNYDLSYEQIESGQVGKGSDGGIDCIYGFVNGELIADDTDTNQLGRDISLELFIMQAKFSPTYSETAIEKFQTSTLQLLDLSKPLDTLEDNFNADVLRVMGSFRRVHTETLTKFPSLRIAYHYCTKGSDIHINVKNKVFGLEEIVNKFFPEAEFSFTFSGSLDLVTLARESPSSIFSLTVAETPISTGAAGFLCLVRLRDYYSFITDSNDHLRRQMLDANVRDYEGSNEVNRGIRTTLENPGSDDFWWLNNGITLIASKASLAGKTLTIEDPQVVNGLQTSFEIFNFFSTHTEVNDERNLLIRVVVPSSAESRDSIIRYTNSQTSIPAASLRATEKIHRDIEDYFSTQGLFYERRKNAYKNAGKSKEKIVSIPYLAQAVMAIVLREPDNSRARPSSLIKRARDYVRVFNEGYPVKLYFECGTFIQRIDKFLRTYADANISEERNNLKYHLALFAASLKLEKVTYEPADTFDLHLSEIDDYFLDECLHHIIAVFESEIGIRWLLFPSDSYAKSIESVYAIERRLAEIL